MSRTMEIALKLTGNQSEVKAIGDLLRGVGTSASAASPDVSKLEKELEKLKQQLHDLKGKHHEATEGAKEFQDVLRETAEAPLRTMNRELIHLLNGMGGFAVIAGSVVVGLGLIAGATFELVKSQAEAAEKLSALSIQMGLSVAETGKLSAIAKIAGVDIQSLHGSARFLAAALEDEAGQGKKASEALQKMGIATREFGGEARGIGPIFTDLVEKLSQIESTSERVFMAQRVLPRGAANEVLVLAERLQQAKKAYEEMGIAFDENVNKKLEDAALRINAMGVAWDLFKAKLAAGIAPITIKILSVFTPGTKEAKAFWSMVAGPGFGAPTKPDAPTFGAKENTEYDSLQKQDIGRGDVLADSFAKNANKSIDSMKKALEQGKKDEATALSKASSKGIGEEAHNKAVKDYNDLVKANEKLEASIKQADRFKNAQLQFSDRLLEGMKARQTAIGKIELERQELMHKEGYSSKQASAITAPKVQEEISKLLGDQLTQGIYSQGPQQSLFVGGTVGKKIAEIVKLNNEQGMKDMKSSNDEFIKDLKDQEKELANEAKSYEESFKAFLEVDKANTKDAAKSELSRRQRVRAATRMPGQETNSSDIKSDLQLQIGLAKQLAQIEIEAADATLNRRAEAIDAVREQVGNEESNRQIEEAAAQNQAANIRARAQMEIEISTQKLDAENKLADLQQRNMKEYHDAAGRLFDALKGGPQGIQSFFKDFAFGQAKTIFSNMFAPMLQSVGTALGTSKSPFLAGTIFGSKDGAQSNPPVDKNTTALGVATLAVNKLASSITGASVGGATADGASGGGLIGSIDSLVGNGTPGSGLGNGDFGGETGGASAYRAFGQYSPADASSSGGGMAALFGGAGAAAGGTIGTLLGSVSKAVSGGVSGKVNPVSTLFNSDASGSDRMGAGVAAAGAAFGAFKGIQEATKGGAKNVVGGIGDTAMAIAPLTGPAAPFVMAVGAAMKLVSSFLPDPKALRERAITAELRDARYNQPDPLSLNIDSSGKMITSDFRGRTRVGNAAPQLSYFEKAIGFDPLHPQNVIGAPERRLDPGPPPPTSVVHVVVNTMDSKSFMDNSKHIADATRKAMQEGHSIRSSITNLVRPF